MTHEELKQLTEKVNAGDATDEELSLFLNELATVQGDILKILEEEGAGE